MKRITNHVSIAFDSGFRVGLDEANPGFRQNRLRRIGIGQAEKTNRLRGIHFLHQSNSDPCFSYIDLSLGDTSGAVVCEVSVVHMGSSTTSTIVRSDIA